MANPILQKIREQTRNGFRFYVYLLRKSDGTPFYIGKGTNRRVFNHERDAKGKKNHPALNTIRKEIELGNAIGKEIDSWHQTAEAAYHRERQLVQEIGCRYDGTGPLMNLRPGGSGGDASGLLKWRRENPEAYAESLRKAAEKKKTRSYLEALSERVKREFAENPERQLAMVEKANLPEAVAKSAAGKVKWARENPEKVLASHEKRNRIVTSNEFRKSQSDRLLKWQRDHPVEAAEIVRKAVEARKQKRLERQS